MIGKQVELDTALDGLVSGMTVAVSGFGLSSNPEVLIRAVVERQIRELTLVANNAGALGRGLATWLEHGLVRRFIGTYVGNNRHLQQAIDGGEVEVVLLPQGTFVERLRAAGAGLAGFYTPTGVGTVVAEGKELRHFDGQPYLLERPLPVDFAFVRAEVADLFGNARFRGTGHNFGPAMAMAAQTAILEADRVVELGGLKPDDVHLSGGFVQRVLHAPDHEDPVESMLARSA